VISAVPSVVSPFGGGEGEDGKRENRRQETGNRKQETGDNFKPLLPMCKTSTPGPSGHPRRRGTIFIPLYTMNYEL